MYSIFKERKKLKYKSEEAIEIIGKNQKDVRNFAKTKEISKNTKYLSKVFFQRWMS